MFNKYLRNNYLWFGVALAAVLLVAWFATRYIFQSPSQEINTSEKIGSEIDEEGDYQYVNKSKTEQLGEIKKQFSINDYKAQIENQKEQLQDKFKNPDIIERIALERELALLQFKIENYKQFYDEKLKLLLEAFQSLEQFRDEFSPNEYNSAQAALINGDTVLADQLFAKLDAKYRVTLGGDGIDRAAEAVYQQGKIAEDQINYRKAYQYYRQAVRYDPGNIEYLVAAGKLADSIALYSKAIVYYEAALFILQKNKGVSPDDIRQLLISLGKTWGSKGEVNKSIDYYEQALANDINAFGRIHLNVAEDYNYLGSAWESKGNKQKANEHYHHAVKLFEAELGKTHPITLSATDSLERVMRK